MAALTILSFGTAAAVTGPIMAFCAQVMVTVGGWTIAVGKVALILQALVLLVNLYQAATAPTAESLRQSSDDLTKNVTDTGNIALQMGMAKLAQIGGRQIQAGVQAAGGATAFARGMPARFAQGVKAIPGRVAAGAQAVGRGLQAAGRGIAAGARATGRAIGRGLAAVRALGARALVAVRAAGTRAIRWVRRQLAIRKTRLADRPLEPVNPKKATVGHGHAEHGWETTLAQQEQRIRTGALPSGATGKPPAQASWFRSPEAEAEALTLGRRKLEADVSAGAAPKYTVNPATGVPEPTRHPVQVASSDPVNGFGQRVYRQMSGGKPVKDPLTGQYVPVLDPNPQLHARIVWEYVPSIDNWRPVTYFPEP
jgi:hypothetical protein